MKGFIAIGSNSVRMLSFDENTGALIKGRAENPLFLSLDEKGFLSEKGIDDTINAIQTLLSKNPTDRLSIVATSASRDAKNSEVLKNEIKKHFDKDMRILSGVEEAEASYLGACYLYKGKSAMIDIGGGSVEIALGADKKIAFMQSLQLGASRLLKKSGGNTYESFVKNALPYVKEELDKLPQVFDKNIPYILLGGTGTILKDIAENQRKKGRKNDVGDTIMSLETAEYVLSFVINKSLDERLKIAGLPKKRINIFPSGLLILTEIMRKLDISDIIISKRSNMHGLLVKEGLLK